MRQLQEWHAEEYVWNWAGLVLGDLHSADRLFMTENVEDLIREFLVVVASQEN